MNKYRNPNLGKSPSDPDYNESFDPETAEEEYNRAIIDEEAFMREK